MSEISGAKTSGYLMKRGEKGIVKGYKRRWFIFNAEDSDKRMFYYPSRDDMSKDLGFISLHAVVDIRKAANQSQFEFEVVVPGRIYYLQAPNEKEMNIWMSTLKPHTKGGAGHGDAGSSSGADAALLREKDEKIALLEKQLKLLKGEGGETDEQKLRLDLHAAREENERLRAAADDKSKQCSELEKRVHSKEDEVQALQIKLKKAEDSFSEELTELKKEYFRACAIGIVQQRKITKDLPPVAELYKSCLDDNTEWKDFVPWIKTTLPKK